VARKRRSFTPSFKAKVALEAVKEVKTITEIAQKHKLHPTQINLWKKQLLDGAEGAFLDGRIKQPASAASDEPEAAELYEQIGRLKVQLEWLTKMWPMSVREARSDRRSTSIMSSSAFVNSAGCSVSIAARSTTIPSRRLRRVCESCV
jgi:transposase